MPAVPVPRPSAPPVVGLHRRRPAATTETDLCPRLPMAPQVQPQLRAEPLRSSASNLRHTSEPFSVLPKEGCGSPVAGAARAPALSASSSTAAWHRLHMGLSDTADYTLQCSRSSTGPSVSLSEPLAVHTRQTPASHGTLPKRLDPGTRPHDNISSSRGGPIAPGASASPEGSRGPSESPGPKA